MPRTCSLLRYPGGKTQLYPFINNLLTINRINGTYIEPFAGGAGVAIKLLLEKKVERIWINDYDKSIYSVWYAVLNHPKKLISLISDVPFDVKGGNMSDEENIEYWKFIRVIHDREKNHQNSIMNAFSTLMLNRMNVSGIINGGPIGGFSQDKNKLYVRFNKKTLISKIKKINQCKSKIRLTRMDALKMIPIINHDNNSFIFFDPPYFKQGDTLYMSSFSNNDHLLLSKIIIKELSNFNWIVTYDDDENIRKYYKDLSKKYFYQLNYSANNKNRGKAKELLFSSDNLDIESFYTTKLTEIDK
ncbi:DNA adenine methylase [Apilactobacillus kunkeei]|uniref:DNA adenine methylase n=1 Tax=Apilactobacillus kunkeei TaxID=148814 RepID=UPI0039E01B04